MSKDDGGQVYPTTFSVADNTTNIVHTINLDGISRRDWLAGLAMQGYLANPEMDNNAKCIAQDAYTHADAMIARGKM